MKATASFLLAKLPGPISENWPTGERFIQAFAHGTMSVELYAPVDHDPQTPHEQDELYIIHSGAGELVIEQEKFPFKAGDVLFVKAGAKHRFEDFSADFATWVIFWGPKGGEANQA